MKIETDRLVLRDLTDADTLEVHAYASDPEVVQYMDWGPNSLNETVIFIKKALQEQGEKPRYHYTLAVEEKTENRLIGSCGLHVSNPADREGWIGYCFNKRFWGRGYATEAAKALVALGFRELSLHRVFATCDPTNTASARVLEKAGMIREGHLREHKWSKGRWRDSFLYAIVNQRET